MKLKYPRRKKRTIGGNTFKIKPPTDERSKVMSRIGSKNTSIEILLAKELRKNKIKYRSGKNLYGKPDFVILDTKIAVFCDGDFWHGYKSKRQKTRQPKTNSRFWRAKIERNIERDKEVNRKLKKEGWQIVRLWEHQIKKNINGCINKIEKKLNYEKK